MNKHVDRDKPIGCFVRRLPGVRSMTRSFMALLLGGLVWFGAFVSVASAYVGIRFGDIVVKQEPSLASSTTYHGYVEYRFSVSNLSKSKTSTVRLSMLGDSSRQFHIRGLQHSVVVGPNSRVMVPLLQPSVTLHSSYLQVNVDNGQEGGSMRLRNVGQSISSHRNKKIVVLLGAQIKSAISDCAKNLTNNYTGNKYKKSYQQIRFLCTRSSIPSSEWGKSWLSLTAFDGVILQASELKEMSPTVRDTLFRYVEVGGTLAVLGPWSAPEHWPEASTQLTSRYASTDFLSYFPGFGKVLIFPKHKDLNGLYYSNITRLAGALEQSFSPFKKTHDMGRANTLFPVIGNLKIPVRGIFFVMLLFSLAIGPLNLWLLWRKKKRIMMLVTVPVAALLTCVLVFAYAVFSEGWDGYERTESITILDQTTRRASTVGWSAFYMPITPGSGLQFGYNTELSPQFRAYFWRGSGRGLRLDWSKGQSLASGWIASRLPLHLKFRKNQVRRERLLISQTKAGTVEVTNGLGKEIKRLWLADLKGKLFQLKSPLAPGAKRKLSDWKTKDYLITSVTKSNIPKLRQLYSINWLKAKNQVMASPTDYLRPGSYIAEMKHSPFVDTHKGEVGHLREKAVVIGLWKGGRHGS